MKKTRPGYTLIELMIVVILIAIIAAIAAPQISQGMANNAVATATNETILQFRAARTIAKQRGRAMGVYIETGGEREIVRLDQSTDNTCANLPTCTTEPPDFGGSDCGLNYLALDESRFSNSRVEIGQITVGVSDSESSVRVCVPPRGRMKQMVGSSAQDIDGFLVVGIRRVDSGGDPVGVTRQVIVGQNGLARTLL